MVIERFDVYLINLDPTIGSEIKKTRPCLIIVNDRPKGATHDRANGATFKW